MHKKECAHFCKDIFYKQPFDFSKYSTIGCGGYADVAYFPQDETELETLISRLDNYYIIGNMSNVLPPEGLCSKTIICTKKLKHMELQKGGEIYVSAGVTSGLLLRTLREAGWSGAEFLIGIPATVGGLLYMNGGAAGKYIAEIVQSVRIYHDGRVHDIPASACGYAYKKSVFMQTSDVILGATLRLQPSDCFAIVQEEKRYNDKRAHLPKGKSMGCIFKNPKHASAGAYIEMAGLKGLRFGGAHVSQRHANFIINDQNATAQDVRALISIVKKAVYAQCGVRLEEEIRYLQ